ncbi:MAG: SDR family oxidoreductase [Gemmataceae bacterium]|nr:SDR family oxidoreductase [Gemmataceae bacterium]
MEQCLVTGGAGFIGSHLVGALLARGDRVRVLDDFSTGKRNNLNAVKERVELIEGSVTDPQAVGRAVQGCQVIYHLAALPSVARSVEEPVPTHEICATGTLHVLDAARRLGVRRVVYAASSSAYGDNPGAVRREEEPVSPMSPYAAAKLAGEFYCRCFTTVYGLETVRLRFFNIFGPRQDASSPYSGVIALFIGSMAQGRVPRIDGDGLQSRDFTYVENAVQAVLKGAAAPAAVGNVYNVGTGNSITVLDLVRHLNELLGTTITPTHGPPRAGDVRYSQADITRARQDLGYEPGVSFVEGLRRTLEWYQREARG